MIIVTGGAGFIGNNLVRGLNARGIQNILVVDNLSHGIKFKNLNGCQIADYVDKQLFLQQIQQGYYDHISIKAIFHQGACSTTTEWDGRYMMENNYEYSKTLLHYCLKHEIAFIYASSAAVYGGEQVFQESTELESPLNVYGYSKYQFDCYLKSILSTINSQVVGLRYFNVYGSGETHKGKMASVAFHLNNQLLDRGKIHLFEGCDGYGDGEQRRDFIYISDVVDVNLWFMDNSSVKGIFNLGTGNSQTFNEVAHTVLDFHQRGELEYIPFPEHLKGHYQSFTEANLSALRAAGCQHRFKPVEEGVRLYMHWLNRAKQHSVV